MKKFFLICFWVMPAWLAPAYAFEPVINDVVSAQQLIKVLQKGGHIMYMRHAKTDHTTKDRINNTFESCDKQRNLSAEGREQAVMIGRALKDFQIPIGDVLSSPFCRCKDTAKLSFGRFEVDKNLQFSMSKNKEESRRLGKYLYKLMKQLPVDENNTVLVGHTSNLKEGLGKWPKPEGVVMVFKNQGDVIVFKGVIEPTDWQGAL